MKRLNQCVFGNAAKRYGKQLRVIAVTEKGEGRWHKHVAIEPPEHLTPEAFEFEIWLCWNRTHWGYKEIDIQRRADRGWVDYMLKPRQKSGLETYIDCIDLNSLKCCP